MSIIGTSVLGIVFALLLLGAVLAFFWRLCPRLLPRAVKSTVLMCFQMAVVGCCLYAVFLVGSVWLATALVVLIALVGSFTVCRRAGLRRRTMVLSVLAGQVVGVPAVGLYVLLLVFGLSPHEAFSPRWMVGVAGLLLCEVQVVMTPALKEYHASLQRDRQLQELLLGNGATRREALAPFVRKAIEKSFSTAFASVALVGLTIFPEMLYAQILSGLSPTVAVTGTLVIIVAGLAASALATYFTIHFSSNLSQP